MINLTIRSNKMTVNSYQAAGDVKGGVAVGLVALDAGADPALLADSTA